MVKEILLIISVILQIIAAIVAIGLTRRTKYNLSWMLFTVALTCMAFLRLGEYVQITDLKEWRLPSEFFIWTGIVTSLCFAVGMLLVQKIFNYIARAERQRRISERRILNTVLRTEEKERQRFSKDLHDGLGPLLSSAKMSISALSSGDTDERNREILRNANYVIDEAIRSLREISVNLSPHILNDFGLSRAISNFINRLPRGAMRINFSTNLRTERFDMDIEVILYRIVCELINNSLKHSGASVATVSLVYADGVLRLVQNVTKGLHVNEKIVEKLVWDYLPFIATENLMMAAVKRGGDRQQLHEIIRRHSMAATARMKEGLPCDLLDRLAGDPAFSLSRKELEALMEPQRYIGRCPQQVRRFLDTCAPLLHQAQSSDGDIRI